MHLDFHFKVIVYTGGNQIISAVKYPNFVPMTKCTRLDFGKWKQMTLLKEQLRMKIRS